MKPEIALGFILLQGTRAFAYDAASQCDTAAIMAAKMHGVPTQVMLAVARVETGRDTNGQVQPWPWAVNHAGDGHWFETREAAQDYALGVARSGDPNLDIGCFQLNLRWHGANFGSLEEMFDPESNAEYAARFLVENYQRKGNWVDAVAAYHSSTATNAKDYVARVESVLIQLGEEGQSAFAEPARPEQARPKNRFPLLQAGASGALASLVPQHSSGVPLFSAAP